MTKQGSNGNKGLRKKAYCHRRGEKRRAGSVTLLRGPPDSQRKRTGDVYDSSGRRSKRKGNEKKTPRSCKVEPRSRRNKLFPSNTMGGPFLTFNRHGDVARRIPNRHAREEQNASAPAKRKRATTLARSVKEPQGGEEPPFPFLHAGRRLTEEKEFNVRIEPGTGFHLFLIFGGGGKKKGRINILPCRVRKDSPTHNRKTFILTIALNGKELEGRHFCGGRLK